MLMTSRHGAPREAYWRVYAGIVWLPGVQEAMYGYPSSLPPPTGAALLTFTLTEVTFLAWEESPMRLMVPLPSMGREPYAPHGPSLHTHRG